MNEAGNGKAFLHEGHGILISFSNTFTREDPQVWGIRPTALLVLLLDQGPRLGLAHQKYCCRAALSPDRLRSPKTGCLCLVSGETLSRRGPLVRVGQDCGAGLRPEAQVRERPGPLGGQPGVWALVCNLKLEEVVQKEILRPAKNRRDLETRKMRAWVRGEWEITLEIPPSLKSKCYCLPSESNSMHILCL